jgi:peptide-methionine (S)-S-oxide reductase
MTTSTTRLLAAAAALGVLTTSAAAQRPRASAVAAKPPIAAPRAALDTAVFAGGCFWGVEGVFEHLKGVTLAESGYAGGTTKSPTYEDVGSGTTGHAESVRVVYDPAVISYQQLLQVFFSVAHDPTQLNYQGPDHGTQYRSAVFFRNAKQKQIVQKFVAELSRSKQYDAPIVTQLAPLTAFYVAEEYHQNYMALHPNAMYIVRNDAPKVERLRREFAGWYRES